MPCYMQDAVRKCFSSGDYSDLTIRYGSEQELKVHKNVVCGQSEYFAKAVDDGRFKEGHTGIIELPKEDNPDTVIAVVDFFYTGSYKVPGQADTRFPLKRLSPDAGTLEKLNLVSIPSTKLTTTSSGSKSFHVSYHNTPLEVGAGAMFGTLNADEQERGLLFHLSVYEFADRIQQNDLKKLVEQKFDEAMEDTLPKAQFLRIVRRVYEVTPPGQAGELLRSVVVDSAVERTKQLAGSKSFRDLVRELHDFSSDLALALVQCRNSFVPGRW